MTLHIENRGAMSKIYPDYKNEIFHGIKTACRIKANPKNRVCNCDVHYATHRSKRYRVDYNLSVESEFDKASRKRLEKGKNTEYAKFLKENGIVFL